MGIIKRQSIKNTLVKYLGVGIGVISTLWIYPLNLELYGLAQFIIGTASLLIPFAVLGIPSLIVRFFPEFRDKGSHHHGFLGLIFWATLFSFTIFLLIIWLLYPFFLKGMGNLGFDIESFKENELYLGVICFLAAFTSIFVAYASNFKRIVVPNLINELIKKIGLALLILLAVLGILAEDQFKFLLLGIFFMVLVGQMGYLMYLGEFNLLPSFKFLSRPLIKRMRTYALYGIMGNIGAMLAFRIDSMMVATLIDYKSNGVYNIALFISNVIAIPFLSIGRISNPLISSAWSEGNTREIQKIYRKASSILMLTGSVIFLLVWSSIQDIFALTSNREVLASGVLVVLFLGLAKLVDMVTGLNDPIISHSKYFKFNLLAIIILGVSNIFLNYYLIGKYQIVGAAMATCLSLILFNMSKYFFILFKFKMQPFGWDTLILALLGIVSYGIIYLLPETVFPIINIFIHALVIASVYGFVLFKFDLVPDASITVRQIIRRVEGFFRR